jgi:hypothetical protein
MEVAPFESCIVCYRGDVMTGIAFRGEAEWVLAGLKVLGVPEEDVYPTLRVFLEEEGWTGAPDEVPSGQITVPVRVCADCAAKTPFSVGRLPNLPAIELQEGGE